MGQDRIGQDKTGQDRIAQDRTGYTSPKSGRGPEAEEAAGGVRQEVEGAAGGGAKEGAGTQHGCPVRFGRFSVLSRFEVLPIWQLFRFCVPLVLLFMGPADCNHCNCNHMSFSESNSFNNDKLNLNLV